MNTRRQRVQPAAVTQTSRPAQETQAVNDPRYNGGALAHTERENQKKADREEEFKKAKEATYKLYPDEPERFSLTLKGKESSITGKGRCFYRPSETGLVLLDNDAFDITGYHSEHEIVTKRPNSNFRETSYEPCIVEIENCPLCENVKGFDEWEGISKYKFRWFMTVIRDSYIYFDTVEQKEVYVPIRKMLMPLGLDEQEYYSSILERKGGRADGSKSWRGMQMYTMRGTDKTSSKLGQPECDGVMDEATLEEWVTAKVQEGIDNGAKWEFEDDAGKPVDPVTYFLTTFNYRKPAKTGDELRKLHNFQPMAGSRNEYASSFANNGGGRASNSGRSAPVTRSRTTQNVQPDDLGEDSIPFDADN